MMSTTQTRLVRVKDLKHLRWLCWSREGARTVVLKSGREAESPGEIAYWPRGNGRNWSLRSQGSTRYYSENQLRAQTRVLEALEGGALSLEVGAYEDYRPVCPACGHDGMTVVRMTLAYVGDGEPIDVRIPLERDGFDSYDTCLGLGFDEKSDFSTEDEVVACDACGRRYALGELMTEQEA